MMTMVSSRMAVRSCKHLCSRGVLPHHLPSMNAASLPHSRQGGSIWACGPLQHFKTEEEAVRIANDTNAGLVAHSFTNNVQRSWRVTEALEYRLIGVNEGLISTEVAPFGGVKQSGLGREGSKYKIDEYVELLIPQQSCWSFTTCRTTGEAGTRRLAHPHNLLELFCSL